MQSFKPAQKLTLPKLHFIRLHVGIQGLFVKLVRSEKYQIMNKEVLAKLRHYMKTLI